MMSEANVTRWIDQAKQGDSIASQQLWQYYFERLIRAARAKLQGQDRRVADEEDIVVSVFESFYRAAQQGRFAELSDRDALWRLLLRMSSRKIIDRRRHDGRQRRGAGQRAISLHGPDDQATIIEIIGKEPTPEMVLMMTEACEQLLNHLGVGTLRDIAVGKMEGYSNADLAERFACSERTIERRLRLIREKYQQELSDTHE